MAPEVVAQDEYVNPIPNDFRYTKGNGVILEDVCVAAYRGDFEKLEEQLSTGNADTIFNGDVNTHLTDVNPLHFAALGGNEECVKLLLEAKADPHVRQSVRDGQDPKTGDTARDKAIKFNHESVAKLLEQAEKDTPLGWYVPDGIANNKKLYSPPDPNHDWFPLPADKKKRREKEEALKNAQLPVALVFPGQGSQYVKMLDSTKDIPEVKDMLDKARDILGYDLLELCLNGPEEKLAETKHCQPAMFIAGLAGVAKLKAEKPEAVNRAQCVAGLSLGEYTALCCAEVLSFEDGLKLVKLRGEAMQEAATIGRQCMISVAGLEENVLEGLCAQAAATEGPDGVCKIANHLFPKGFSCAGTETAVLELEKLAIGAKALQAKVLKTSGGFHTSLMKPAEEKLRQALEEVLPNMKPPRCDVYMNVIGKAMPKGTEPKEFLDLMQKQLTSAVLWTPCVKNMINDGVKEFYECGPGKQLKAMMKRIDMNMWKDMANVEV